MEYKFVQIFHAETSIKSAVINESYMLNKVIRISIFGRCLTILIPHKIKNPVKRILIPSLDGTELGTENYKSPFKF